MRDVGSVYVGSGSFSYAGPECAARSVMGRRPKTYAKADLADPSVIGSLHPKTGHLGFATHVSNGEWTTVHCRRPINQGFIDLFGQQGSVIVPHL